MALEDIKKGTIEATKKVGRSTMKAAGSTIGLNFGIGLGIRKLTGQSWGQAIVGEAGEAVAMAIAPGAYWTWTIGSMVAGLPGAVYRGGQAMEERYNESRRKLSQPTFRYQDTQQAVTMRQAAVQAIQGSKLNARNALGGEASLMHRGYKDRYR